ncbi:MAG: glycine--tRNA ligase subunit beta [Hyphomicrobiales bacterium]|nr:glycine--tRNA ligase subunit beta [Hyphomicrobiales bacterium]
MAELLLELLSEEIPARMQARAAADLQRLVCDGLKEAGLEFARADAFATPRRLALVVDGLPAATPDISEERRGPRADAPEKAIEGFLRGSGITRDQAVERETPKGTFLFAVIEKKGQATRQVLAQVLPKAMAALPWPKSMRWADRPGRWVRPLHRIVALFDGAVVGFDFNGLRSGNTTLGHRFLAVGEIPVTGFDDYRTRLRAAKVVLDPAERRAIILDRARELAAAEGLVLGDEPALLDEVAGLVEWPVPLVGRIDAAFMDVPAEALVTSMKSHQKYFPLHDGDGNLAARFVVVANTETRDGNAQVVAGNERVLRARLSDAKFFWDQDRRRTLESRAPKLAEITFHAKLGTVAERAERMAALARDLCRHVPGADPDTAARAAHLAKCDLVSEMVGEFPELQGVMGRYYALNDGEPADVARAVAEHYAPQGPGDACPTAPVSVAVALAEKLDTLAGFWAIGEKPTGSKDPYALRRAALGVIRLIIENGLRLSLSAVLERAYWLYDDTHADFESVVDAGVEPSAVVADAVSFFADRLKVHLREQGVRHDHIDAVFALGGEDDLVRLLARVAALGDFLASDDGANLLTAYRRAANILRIEEKKDGASYESEADPALFEQDEEAALAAALADSGARARAALDAENFAGAMAALAMLRAPVDSFFDHVTVNCEDARVRANRLRLLSRIRAGLGGVADFSKIEG